MLFKDLLSNVVVGLINHQQVRGLALWRNVRPIMGWPRPHLWAKGKKYPEAHKYNWLPYLPEDGSYTIKPLPIHKMAGRDFDTGRVVVRTLGGGNTKKFRWVDLKKSANLDGSTREERVMMIRYDPLRTPKLALVGGEDNMRWILATHGLKEGDIVRTYSEIPRNPVKAKDGDAHPVGALQVGTKINQLEIEPGKGAKFCLVAGSAAEIVKRGVDGITITLPHGDSFKVDKNCMCVVGELSNVDHQYVEMWCPQRLRWLGKRPRSGQWRRKDGYCGRKSHQPKIFDVTVAALEARRLKELQADPLSLEV